MYLWNFRKRKSYNFQVQHSFFIFHILTKSLVYKRWGHVLGVHPFMLQSVAGDWEISLFTSFFRGFLEGRCGEGGIADFSWASGTFFQGTRLQSLRKDVCMFAPVWEGSEDVIDHFLFVPFWPRLFVKTWLGYKPKGLWIQGVGYSLASHEEFLGPICI